MQTEPKFKELQALRPKSGESSSGWEEGIAVALLCREAGTDRVNAKTFPAGWLYKIQTGPNRDLADIRWPENKLAAS